MEAESVATLTGAYMSRASFSAASFPSVSSCVLFSILHFYFSFLSPSSCCRFLIMPELSSAIRSLLFGTFVIHHVRARSNSFPSFQNLKGLQNPFLKKLISISLLFSKETTLLRRPIGLRHN